MIRRFALSGPLASFLLVSLLLATGASRSALQPQQPQPAERVHVPNAEYDTPEKRARIAERLDSPDREKSINPEKIVAALGIRPGQRVADIGTGTGLVLQHLSRAVGPKGIVYAEDIFPDFLERGRARAEELKLDNVIFVLGSTTNPRLPPGEIDLAVMVDSYHHFEYPKAMLDMIRQSLKPEGRIAIIDYYKRGTMTDHIRLDKDAVAKEVEKFGWKFEGSPEVTSNQYILLFRRPPM